MPAKTRNIENYEFEFQTIFKHEKTRPLLAAFAKKEFNEGMSPNTSLYFLYNHKLVIATMLTIIFFYMMIIKQKTTHAVPQHRKYRIFKIMGALPTPHRVRRH